MIRNQIFKDLKPVLLKLKISPAKLNIEHPADSSFGDYATNIALRIKKKDFANSIDLANYIVNTWRTQGLPDYLAKIEVVQPGFINLWLKKEFFVSQIDEVLKRKDGFGKLNTGKGQTVVIDYSGPNIAKPFGIGHLRSTNIGQALYNLYKFAGWRTIGVNHLGDWGTQFGKLIVAIKKWQKKGAELDIQKLEKLYVKFHQEAAKNPKLEDEARDWFKRLEDRDPEARKIWEACVKISTKEFERVYKLLDVKFDYLQGESFYQEMKYEVINEARKKNVTQKSQGALIIPFPDLPAPLLLLKTDGTTTYETRELATIKYRKQKWHPNLLIWETGVDQRLHFQQCFEAAERLGYGKKSQFVHVAHGLIRLKEGKFSTRQGLTIHLEDVLNEAIKRAVKIIKASGTSRGLSSKTIEKVARAVGIGAVKYSDLKQNPQTDIVFDWERIFSLEGDSGPYLQYTYARCRSVLRRAGITNYQLPITNLRWAEEELAFLRTLYRFPEIVEEAAKNFAPNLICAFLFDLAQKYNLLYNRLPILKSEKKAREFRLALTSATAQVLKNGLNLLGIETLEKM